MNRGTRIGLTIVAFFSGWRVSVEFMAVPGALGIGLALAIASWVLTGLVRPPAGRS